MLVPVKYSINLKSLPIIMGHTVYIYTLEVPDRRVPDNRIFPDIGGPDKRDDCKIDIL